MVLLPGSATGGYGDHLDYSFHSGPGRILTCLGCTIFHYLHHFILFCHLMPIQIHIPAMHFVTGGVTSWTAIPTCSTEKKTLPLIPTTCDNATSRVTGLPFYLPLPAVRTTACRFTVTYSRSFLLHLR